MKKIFIITLLGLSTSAFSNTVKVFNFDDVDAVTVNGKTVKVEDLRDGFYSIKGVQVNDKSVSITTNSQATLLFRNTIMSAKSGGDMGGG
jgi:hypothetical protein